MASERFDMGRYPVLFGVFGKLGEERQKQAVRMLASNIKCVADEALNIEVKGRGPRRTSYACSRSFGHNFSLATS